MNPSFRKMSHSLSIIILLFSIFSLTGCFEKKEELTEESSTSPAPAPAPAPDPYANVTLSYDGVPAYYTYNSNITNLSPSSNISDISLLTNFRSSPPLPGGIEMNSTTGVISGTPLGFWETTTFTISANKPSGGSVSTTISFGILDSGMTSDDDLISQDKQRNFNYAQTEVTYYIGVAITDNTPSHSGPSFSYYTDGFSSETMFSTYGLSINTSTGVISGTPHTAVNKVKIPVTGTFLGGNSVVYITMTILNGPPSDLTYSTPIATYPIGHAITNNTPSHSGGDISSYSVSPALPVGLSLNTTTGVISGTPTAITSATDYTITASNAAGSTIKVISIATPNAAPANLNYSNANARYTVGAAIATNSPGIGAGGAATSYAVSPSLPSGLSFDTTTGVITGTPTSATASATYTVTASNVVGSTTKNLTIVVVVPGPHTIYSADGNTITAYSVDIVTGEPIYVGKTFSSSIISPLVFHPTKDCAFGYSSNALFALSVDKVNQGQLSVINSAGLGSGARNLDILSSGNYIYVVNDQDPSTQYISRFSVNPTTCAVAALGTTSVWTSTTVFARDLAVAGNNVYVLNTAAQIFHFTVDTGTGALTQSQIISMAAHSNPPSITPSVGQGQNLRAHPNGSYIYATDSLRAIESFSVNVTTGQLSSLGTMVNSGTYYLNPLAVDKTNEFIFSCYNSAFSAGISTIKLASNGSTSTWSTIAGSAITTGYSAPQSVYVFTSESGTYIYTTYSYTGYSGAIRLNLNTSNGALTTVGGGLWGILSGY